MVQSKTTDLRKFAEALVKSHGRFVKRSVLLDEAAEQGIEDKLIYKEFCRPEFRGATRGTYDLDRYLNPSTAVTVSTVPVLKPRPAAHAKTDHSEMNLSNSNPEVENICYIPVMDPGYVRWGYHKDVETIIKSGHFFPIYIAGPSGNGKTFMVEQACAKAGREYIRVNVSPETDEDDLIGGFRLKDGNTIFEKGPVVKAMEAGAVLLIDEIDRGTNKLMCMQSVLEGSSILLKKTGETVYPSPGFTVIATANTSGRGSEDGRFTAAFILDEAFLERFPIMINQPWPTESVEHQIVVASMNKYGFIDEDFATKLCSWAKIIRKTFEADGVEDVVSTRRLDHIAKTFAVFQDRTKAIELAVSRFSPETTEAFIDLYKKIDAGEIDPAA